ncbi:Formate--tetrahydrofolate ligase [Oenococcus oeni]|uniref:Formate--tetrahydrofolate ligase n=1 Tax=Oenococcus oeni TaxID=1247 RepID=A0AAQ2ZEC9_OENOE|nr:formate--tetrahydrofolate ligase [Oenococcus oeni]OIL38450.1 formate--tetrahydrofolate ligase [Oenococcus oeni]OLQ40643.1 formate--tetrahydrofolate ligase [Oenococcus oeni]SYW07350.1 Formate--tetrahydrofolate ligase [Oenococcus oeni]VDB97812.1 Formate--tetrahydrofolate ligase [Oenococcus oeni]
MKSDIEIAHSIKALPITEIGKQIGLSDSQLIPYGHDKAKIDASSIANMPRQGKLVLVTSINPTPAGEGKTTVTIGLVDAINRLGKSAIGALREPSMGPVFGLKGGATGGGYAQVIPMEDINLHFTGDIHAVSAAHNLLAAVIDNHLHQGNELKIDPENIYWRRVLDMNDRALRQITLGKGRVNGPERNSGFDITASSEIMAVLTLSKNLFDLKKRLSRIVVALDVQGKPVTVADLKVAGALTAILKDAINPNLVQSLEHSPFIIHGGPFANIAQGTNSVVATDAALKLADFAVTEAGFGSDLGGEKFMDVKVPVLGKEPDAVVIVATVKALKFHGGVALDHLSDKNVDAVRNGLDNLNRHLEAMTHYGKPVVVALNKFLDDDMEEIQLIKNFVEGEKKLQFEIVTSFVDGFEGSLDLAKKVIEATDNQRFFMPLYQADDSIEKKIQTIVEKIYGGKDFELSDRAKKDLAEVKENGWGKLPVVIAKTPNSLTDDSKIHGAPTGFTIHIRRFIPKIGAGFIVAMAGKVLMMPGLGKKPAAEKIDVDENGKISGLS